MEGNKIETEWQIVTQEHKKGRGNGLNKKEKR